MSMLTLFESRYTLKEGTTLVMMASFYEYAYFESRYTLKEGTTLVMMAKLLL